MSRLAVVGAAAQKHASFVLRTILTGKHHTSDIMLLIERPKNGDGFVPQDALQMAYRPA